MEISKDQVKAYLKSQFREGDVVIKLIFINLGIYLFIKIVYLLEWALRTTAVSSFIREWFYLPNQAKELLYKFYTVLSYQFIHDSFLHLFVNLMMLFFFGKLIIQHIGFKKLLPLYILGGIFGALLFVSLSTLHVVSMLDMPMIGASASIMALMGASAMLFPNYILKFFLVFDVKLKWLVAGFALLNAFSLFTLEGAGSAIIHLGGLVFGISFIYFEQQGFDLAKPFNAMLNSFIALFNKRPQPKVTYVNPNRNKSSKPVKKNELEQEKVDAILDKISLNGYESLSKEEKEYLFKASK